MGAARKQPNGERDLLGDFVLELVARQLTFAINDEHIVVDNHAVRRVDIWAHYEETLEALLALLGNPRKVEGVEEPWYRKYTRAGIYDGGGAEISYKSS